METFYHYTQQNYLVSNSHENLLSLHIALGLPLLLITTP